MGDSEVVLSTSDITFLDHESRIKELESNLASSMRREFRLHQCISVLEGRWPSNAPKLSDSDTPCLCCHRVPGEKGTPYPCLSQHLQMVCCSSGPPCEENCEYWASDGSKGCPLRFIPIEDVTISPPLALSSSEDREYHEAPIESGGIIEVDNKDLDL